MALALICLPWVVQAQNAEQVGTLFEKFSWRSIGPANMGGRVVDIEVVEEQPWIIFAAIGPSGVWKSNNNGITWRPIFSQENTVSVGDIAIFQKNPDLIWVGTGEATARNSVTIGDGVYRSSDGGKTWENMGLENTRHISRILLHPRDPDIVYVAAQGHLWGPNEERGVYKTTDGGKSWTKCLYINPNAGIADMAMDPSEPDILYAAAWDHQRFPYYFYSGGPGSGLYRTNDGGRTWQRLIKDLPEGVLGRIGVAVARSNPSVVYALIEHEDGGIWRSDDKGMSWTRACNNATYEKINFRPFYYSQIRIDPSNADTVYVFSGGSFVSKDGGKKFKAISGGTHPDHHALWIDPHNPLHLIDGNDGGIDITYDGGKNWYGIKHMALAQVYQLGYDMRSPYYIYCGLQDNGLWGGPSATLDVAGITNRDWYTVGGGDGFYGQPDPSDYNIIYGNYQMNVLYRFDLRLRKSKTIRPLAPFSEPPYRFNWNSPIHISPHDPKTVYTAGNFLFKSIDHGNSWEIISPDLSTNDPEKQQDSGGLITQDNTGAEIHCSIITVAESPVKAGVIWCGTDDGNVQITQDGGKNWSNVVDNIPDLPPNTWCSRIEASHFEAGRAYAAFDGHRGDDYDTYVYRTEDFGRNWKCLKANLPFGWVHVIREDVRNPDLLFVGTEFSVFASFDRGESWVPFKNNLPTVAVRDIAIHPRDNDLIIGTHGRGVWILDDISPLQYFSKEIMSEDMFLFKILPATQYHMGSSTETFTKRVFSARNPEYGMGITVYFQRKPEAKPSLLIKDLNQEQIFKFQLQSKAGFQRVTWNLSALPKGKDGKQIRAGGNLFAFPPLAAPGIYHVELQVGDKQISGKARLLPDPRHQMSESEHNAQVEGQVQAILLGKKMGLSVTAVKNLRRQFDKLMNENQKLEAVSTTVKAALEGFDKDFRPLEDKIEPKKFGYRVPMETALRGGTLRMQMMFLAMSIGGYPSAPTSIDREQLQEISVIVDAWVDELNELIEVRLLQLNQVLEENGIKPLKAPKPVTK